MSKSLRLLGGMALCAARILLAHDVAPMVFVEAERFQDTGGWVLDQQFMDQMGSPFLLAHGLGEPVRDARTIVKFQPAGRYHVWVRTRDWVAPWNAPGAPGRFQVLVDGQPLRVLFGTEGALWHWQDGGVVKVGAQAELALHDLTGFEGRCDAVLFCSNVGFRPPDAGDALASLRRKALGLPEKAASGGEYDLVVVGGGIAGSCAAISAARQGLTVALVQDRPVLGGNGSSEVRVWPEGVVCQPPFPRIGSLVSELVPARDGRSGNRQPAEVYADARKLDLVRKEPRIALFLECRVNSVEATNGRIHAVIAESTRTGARVRLQARYFADCTGDGEVGALAGADFDLTREQHQGASDLWRVEETGAPQPFLRCECKDTNALSADFGEVGGSNNFPRCPWALDLSRQDFPGRPKHPVGKQAQEPNLGDWFWESGFDKDPIADVEWMRDQNLRAMYGAWDTLKNVEHLYPTKKLVWAAFIAGKRESRRLMGEVVLTADDFRTNRVFADGCVPCSWRIDVHSPNPAYQKGHEGEEFISRATRGAGYEYNVPFWMPYRCLYSRNISNLFMAGRDISVTHEALGPVRVMRTCGMMGEIVGMAASVCRKYDAPPRAVYAQHLAELQDLMRGTPVSKVVLPHSPAEAHE